MNNGKNRIEENFQDILQEISEKIYSKYENGIFSRERYLSEVKMLKVWSELSKRLIKACNENGY